MPGLGTLPFPALGAGLAIPNHLCGCFWLDTSCTDVPTCTCSSYWHQEHSGPAGLLLLQPPYMMESPSLRKTIRNGIWCIRRGQRALIRQGARPDKNTEWLHIYMQPVLPFYPSIFYLHLLKWPWSFPFQFWFLLVNIRFCTILKDSSLHPLILLPTPPEYPYWILRKVLSTVCPSTHLAVFRAEMLGLISWNNQDAWIL